MLKGRLAPELPQVRPCLDKDVLADVLQVGAAAGKAGNETEDACLVPRSQFAERSLVAVERGRDQLVVRRFRLGHTANSCADRDVEAIIFVTGSRNRRLPPLSPESALSCAF